MQEIKKISNRFFEEINHQQSRPDRSKSLCCQSNQPVLPQTAISRKKAGYNVYPLQNAAVLDYDSVKQHDRALPYREAVCDLCEKTVSLALDVPLSGMQANTRCNAEMALARQIAMYLCHTMFSLLLTEVGLHFGRDRSTVAHACAVVEDKRDDLTFDVLICQLESLLTDARDAMGICFREGAAEPEDAAQNASSGLTAHQRKMLKGGA